MLYDKNWEKKRVKVPPIKPKPKVKRKAPWQLLLLEAAEIIEQRGWCTGDYQDNRGRVCAVGAMRIAAAGVADCRDDGPGVLFDAHRKLFTAIGGLDSIISWNDQQSNKQVVIRKLREVANLKTPSE